MPDQKPVYMNGKIIGYTSDGKTMTPVSQAPPTSAPASPSFWSKANTPLIPPVKVTGEADTNKAIAQGRPTAAFFDQLKQGTAQSTADLLRSFSSPVSLALAAASGGESVLGESFPALAKMLRALQLGSGAVFTGQGAKEAATGKRPGENTPDMLERRLGSAGQATLGAAGTANAVAPTVGAGLRSMGGASDPLAEQAARDVGKNRADIEKENRQAAEEHAKSVKKVREGNDASRKAVSAGATADQTAAHLTAQISEALPTLAEAVRAEAKAAYPHIEGTTPGADIHAELQTILDDKLKGAGPVPTSISRILSDTENKSTGAGGWGKSSGPTVGGRHFDLSNPNDLKSYQAMKAQGFFTPSEIARMEGTSGGEVSFDDLHGMYSELGRDLYRPGAPDSLAAISDARKYIGKLMQDHAENEGKQDQFNEAQHKWMVYENVFRNTSLKNGSPLARALEYRDPITKKLRPAEVRRVLSGPRAYDLAYSLLEREYPEMSKEIRRSLGLMNQQNAFAREAPKVAKIKAEPEAKAPKTTPDEFNPATWRREQLEKSARGLRLHSGDVGTPFRLRYLPAKLGLQKLLSNPSIQRWLTYQDLEALQKRISSIPKGGASGSY